MVMDEEFNDLVERVEKIERKLNMKERRKEAIKKLPEEAYQNGYFTISEIVKTLQRQNADELSTTVPVIAIIEKIIPRTEGQPQTIALTDGKNILRLVNWFDRFDDRFERNKGKTVIIKNVFFGKPLIERHANVNYFSAVFIDGQLREIPILPINNAVIEILGDK